ncbi:MAG: 4-hydroxy-3-methylbut-2-enyl diphosphate reductase [Spirochaetes bacterium]|nr:4-hydroxy-3-methylbut-2-enyl diphosphate reductase [Spirochaetota bacterium]
MILEIGQRAGFCRGVKQAVERTFLASRTLPGPFYTEGELIHNPQTLELLEANGIRPLPPDPPRDLDASTVIVRAHGVTPLRLSALRQGARAVVNLTCPDVGRVQGTIQKYDRLGYSVAIFGKADHPEVVGLRGYARESFVLHDRAGAEALPPREKLLFVSQTTMDHDAFTALAEFLAARQAGLKVVDTICQATEDRQREAKAMAARCDAMVVVGGRRSSNTRRLVEIAGARVPTYAVEGAGEIDEIPAGKYRRVGITAGASTPDWLIEEVAEALRQREANPWTRRFGHLLRFGIYSSLFPAMGAFFLSFAVADIAGMRYPLQLSFMVSLYYVSMSLLNNVTNRGSMRVNDRQRHAFVWCFRRIFQGVFCAAVGAVLVIGFLAGARVFLITALSLILGVVYNLFYLPLSPKAPGATRLLGRVTRLLPALKSVLLALAVTLLLNGILATQKPALVTGHAWGFLFSCAFVFVHMFTRQALFELKTAQNDRVFGVRGILNLMGPREVVRLLTFLSAILLVSMSLGVGFGIYPLSKIKYFIPVAYGLLFILLHRKLTLVRTKIAYEVLLDSNLFITGAVGWFG